ncbi:Triabin [Popillia japonica]|uniref:Triabin n=1 Tax=Popillia japonica TaxID=7064 RepID=A0AAW1MCQ6_POPJA
MNVFTVSTFLLICIQFSLTYHLFSDCSHFATKRGLFQEQFLGIWYIQETSKSSKDNCLKYKFNNSSGTVYLNISNNSTLNESFEFKEYSEDMYLQLPITYTLKGAAMYAILDTDYDNYLLLWKCKNFYVYAKSMYLVLTRIRVPDKLTLDQTHRALTSGKIKKKLILYKIKQDKCFN